MVAIRLLRRQHRGRQFGTEQRSGDERVVEAKQVAGSHVRTAVGSADRRIRIDVPLPTRDRSVVGTDRFDPFGNVGLDDVHTKEPRPLHSRGHEHVLGDVLAGTAHRLARSIISPSST